MRTTLTLMFAQIGWISSAFAAPVGTGFSYQGQLKEGGVPVTETCDFEFRLWDDPFATLLVNQVGPTLIFDGEAGNSPPIEIVNGLFTAGLDFGTIAFSGEARWLEIDVCCSSPCASGFTTLSPRLELSPAPYALALPAMRVEQNGGDLSPSCLGEVFFHSPNVIGGWHGNTVAADVQGATIAGGGATVCDGRFGFSVLAEFPNTISANYATIGGGQRNTASGKDSAVGGGNNNTAGGDSATVPGGFSNRAGGEFSFAAGRRAKVREAGTDPDQSGDSNGDEGTFVWADSTNANFQSTGPDQFLIRATGGVGIGTNDPTEQLEVVGNITAGGTIESTSGGFKFPNASIQTTAALGDGHSLNAADGSPANALFVNNSGNVGIGTASPSARLDVVGATELNGNVTINSNLTITSDLTINSDLTVDTDKLFVDVSVGRVGIGTTNPATELEIVNEVGAVRLGMVSYRNDVFGSTIRALHARGTGSSPLAVQDDDRLLSLTGGGYDGTIFGAPAASILLEATEDWASSAHGARILFLTTANGSLASVTRMTIENDGNVGIGTIFPDFKLQVNGSAGKPGGGTWSSTSDRRLKKNIQNLDNSLDRLMKLRGVTFEYRDPDSINELHGTRIGMIAQEVEEVFPDWVKEGGHGYKTLTFRGFEALTVEALRELREEKDTQLREKELQIERLDRQVADMQSRLARLESLLATDKEDTQ